MSPYTILVKGLPEDAGVDAVREFFSRAGYIAECTVENTSATISFDNEDDFNEAIRMDGVDFGNGVIIQVSKKIEAEAQDNTQQEQQAQGEASDITAEAKDSEGNEPKSTEGGEEASRDPRKRIREEFKIAVRHLAENTTEEQLRELFTTAGNIVDLFLDQRRRYAFIGFDTAEAVEAALLLSGREVNGGPVDVERKRASPRENVLDFKVVVKGLPPNTTEPTLRAFFAAAGEPVDVFIHDQKNFAFVGFADEAACEQALRMAGEELGGCRVTVERRQRQRCFKCNREGHVALQCRAPELSCRNCGRPGHVIRDCRAPPRDRRFMPHNNNNNNNNNNNFHHRHNNAMHHNSMRGPHPGGYHNNNNYNNAAPGGERRVFYNNNNNNSAPITDRRDYRGGDRREDKKDHYGDRRRARSRSDSYERKHRRRTRSRSRSRSPKRFARDRDRERSRSPPRRRY